MTDKSWLEYSQYVLRALEDNKQDHKDIVDKLDSIEDWIKKDFKGMENEIKAINKRLNIAGGMGIAAVFIWGIVQFALKMGYI